MRAFVRTTDRDETTPWLIPRIEYREQFRLTYNNDLQEAVGYDGAFDMHGVTRAPVGPAEVSFEFSMVSESEFGGAVRPEDVKAMLDGLTGLASGSGLRKLWRADVSVPSAGYGGQENLRFGHARLRDRPKARATRGYGVVHYRVNMDMADPLFYEAITAARLAELGESSLTRAANVIGEPIAPYTTFMHASGAAITSSPTTFTIENDGDIESRWVVFRLESKNNSGFTNPLIENLTTGDEWASTRDGVSSSDVLTVNAAPGLGRAKYSTSGGTNFADDTALLALGAQQGILMELSPGPNTIRYTDAATPNLDLLVFWYHAFRE